MLMPHEVSKGKAGEKANHHWNHEADEEVDVGLAPRELLYFTGGAVYFCNFKFVAHFSPCPAGARSTQIR